jgi:hypothetical protein
MPIAHAQAVAETRSGAPPEGAREPTNATRPSVAIPIATHSLAGMRTRNARELTSSVAGNSATSKGCTSAIFEMEIDTACRRVDVQ